MATRKKTKKLKLADMKHLAEAVRNENVVNSPLKESILNTLSKSKQLTLFPERQQLYSILTRADMKPAYDTLVSSLLEDYLKLVSSSIKGNSKYMDFQVVWLDHIRKIGEQGYLLSTCEAQPLFDGESRALDSSAVHAWFEILTSALAEIIPLSPETNLIMLHTIAREVYDHQQQQIYEQKTTDPGSTSLQAQIAAKSNDDALLRMCGAEVARMIKSRKKEMRRLVDRCHPNVQSLDQQIDILLRMCIPTECKEAMKDAIPASIQHLDRGHLYIPLPTIKPYLQEVDHVFTKYVNNENFRKHGEQLFKVKVLNQYIYSVFNLHVQTTVYTDCRYKAHR